MINHCAECGYAEGEHENDCPVLTGMSRERYALIRRCADEPAWAADEILRLRGPAEPSREPQRSDFMTCGVPDDAAYEAAMARWRALNRTPES